MEAANPELSEPAATVQARAAGAAVSEAGPVRNTFLQLVSQVAGGRWASFDNIRSPLLNMLGVRYVATSPGKQLWPSVLATR